MLSPFETSAILRGKRTMLSPFESDDFGSVIPFQDKCYNLSRKTILIYGSVSPSLLLVTSMLSPLIPNNSSLISHSISFMMPLLLHLTLFKQSG